MDLFTRIAWALEYLQLIKGMAILNYLLGSRLSEARGKSSGRTEKVTRLAVLRHQALQQHPASVSISRK